MITLPSGRSIGEHNPPFIIAEVGSNWSTLDDCLFSIRVAKACGADAVKFQLYDFKSLYGIDVDNIPGSLNPEWLKDLKEQADQSNIEFMCSAFSPEQYEIVNKYVNIHKVASAEMCHVRILEKLSTFNKPVILSTGSHRIDEIKCSIQHLRPPIEDIILMYCVAGYPAKYVELGHIRTLKQQTGLIAGFSDHTLDIGVIPRQAIKYGARVLEKHVNFCDSKGPDSPHSLNQTEFKLMIDLINNQKEIALCSTHEEQDMVLKHNRRLICIKDIKAGNVLVEGENFGIYRSLISDTKALSPFLIKSVAGKRAKQDIGIGVGIGPNDF